MKRSEALKLIANQLDFLNGNFSGGRTLFSEIELKKADVILTTLEDAGMSPPEHLFTSGERNDHYLQEWENE